MVTVTAPEFRGAHRLNAGQGRSWRVLLIASSLVLASTSSLAEELKPWFAETTPTLVLDRLDGARIDLAELPGGPVIVHFFATWCAPCIEEMASLNALAAQQPVQLTILAVDVGEVDARVRTFFRERPVSFPILLDRDRSAMKAWHVEGLPTSFVLDRDLSPAFKAEEPLDWTGPAVIPVLTRLSQRKNGTPAEQTIDGSQSREEIR
ncbi:TlpA family protein disulfide reductase [Bosea sp. 2YAB26]|uniref:TlpA family protein disulfide reductase n=1 Tax=Bosea sp. 2YAB26 TaxID=3237478 RepID=UPI003F91C1C5